MTSVRSEWSGLQKTGRSASVRKFGTFSRVAVAVPAAVMRASRNSSARAGSTRARATTMSLTHKAAVAWAVARRGRRFSERATLQDANHRLKHDLEHILSACLDARGFDGNHWRAAMRESKSPFGIISTSTRRQLVSGVAMTFGGLAAGFGAWGRSQQQTIEENQGSARNQGAHFPAPRN